MKSHLGCKFRTKNYKKPEKSSPEKNYTRILFIESTFFPFTTNFIINLVPEKKILVNLITSLLPENMSKCQKYHK